MIDKKLENNIKKTKTFLEFWSKFHELYRDAVGDSSSLPDKEENFIATRSLVNSRFQDLMDFIGVKHSQRFAKALPLYEILSLENLRGVSDEKFETIDDYWTDSYIFLSSILDRFQKKKRRIEKYNKTIFTVKGFLRRIKN